MSNKIIRSSTVLVLTSLNTLVFAQNIGIGTNTPLDKLHIAGGIRSDSMRIDGKNGTNTLAQFNFYAAGVDQQQASATAVNGNDVPGWQSFTASRNGNLDSVAFHWDNVFVTALTITIYSGEGNSGATLFTQAINTRSATFGQPFTTVPVTGVTVSAGQKYTIALSTARLWGWAGSNPYTGGQSNLNAGIDYAFQTYVGGSSPGLVIKNAGLIGIGTNNPGSKLDIAGNLNVSGNITVGGTLNYTGSFTNENPISLTLLNNWVNYGPGFTNATYYKDRTGVVHLEGLIKSGTTGIIANLPAGYRPSGSLLFIAVNGYGAFARIDVTADGNVVVSDPYTTGYLSLSGITFRALQ